MRTLYFGPVVSSFFYLSIFLFSWPILSRSRSDVYHTITWCGFECEFRMQVWNVLSAARWKHRTREWVSSFLMAHQHILGYLVPEYRTQKIAKKSLSGHHRTILSGNIFATKARIDNRKNCYTAISPPHVLTIWWTSAYWRLRSVR